MINMDSNDDTVGPYRVVPHTPMSVSRAIRQWGDDQRAIVSVDVYGHMMSVLFSDGESGMFWYRSDRKGSNFGLEKDVLQ